MFGFFSLVFYHFRGFTVNVRGVLMFFKGKVMAFLCAYQSKFSRFGCWLTLCILQMYGLFWFSVLFMAVL